MVYKLYYIHLSFKIYSIKIVTFTTSGVTIFVSKVYICGPVIAYLEDITNLEILPYLLHYSEVLKRMLIIKCFVG